MRAGRLLRCGNDLPTVCPTVHAYLEKGILLTKELLCNPTLQLVTA
jgi:hypothetical protein